MIFIFAGVIVYLTCSSVAPSARSVCISRWLLYYDDSDEVIDLFATLQQKLSEAKDDRLWNRYATP